MKMLVDVDVIEMQPGRTEGAELRLDFRPHLRPCRFARRKFEPEPRKVRAQTPPAVHQARDLFRRQHRRSIGQCEMKANAQARQPRGALDRVFGMSSRDHQARSRENAVRASDFDRLVHLARKAEIVGGDDDRIQVGRPLRSRRNDMNSTPSRSRRASICRLRAISATIAAIFEARK